METVSAQDVSYKRSLLQDQAMQPNYKIHKIQQKVRCRKVIEEYGQVEQQYKTPEKRTK